MEENRERVQREGSNIALIIDSNIIFSIIVAGKRARAYRLLNTETSNSSLRRRF